ncbi:MAG TPA: tyrosine-type recombinase/integrase, partial [Acidimicrobiales bacterium]|nr:tyrosine-type recombinase/integrase [Acidimicrobiales bacterium]
LMLGRLRRFLAPADLLEATTGDLVAFLDRHIGAEARATETSHLKGFYSWAHRAGLIDEDPSLDLVRPRVARRIPRPIPTEDLHRALDGAPERVRPWLMLAAYCGLRAHEIAGLRREDVLERREPPVLAVVDGKGGKQRVVPMPDALVSDFAGWDVPARGLLWRKRDGTGAAVPAHLVSRLCNDYLHSVGIGQTLQTLRHWYGTATYEATGDLRLTQEVMGHASPVTTAGYAAWSPRKAAAVLRRLTVAAPDDEDRLREPDGSWIPAEAMARPSLRVVPGSGGGPAS